MELFADWTRSEVLQLCGIASALLVAIIGLVLKKKITEIHVMINSRMTQWLEGAKAEGQVKERAEADARDIAKE